MSGPGASRLRVAVAVAGKDLAVAWATPVPYVVGGLFQAALGTLFIDQLQGRGQALVQPLFPLAGFLLLVTVPILTMRVVAEEARDGTLDVLRAIPVRTWPLLLGKWVAATVTVLGVVAPAGAYAAMVALFGDPDRGPIIAGFLGLGLLAAGLTAVGVLASSLTSSPPVAAMVGFVAGALLWFSGSAGSAISAGGLLARLSLSERLRSFAGGAVDTADVGYFVAVVVGALALAALALSTRRRDVLVGAVLALVATVGLEAGSTATRRVVDLTTERSLSLTDQSVAIAEAVEDTTTVTAFLRPDDPGRAPAAALLLRYQRVNPRIRFRILDPSRSQGEQRRLGVDPELGGVAVARGGEVDLVPTVTEQDVTGALARLERGRAATLCFTTGHGEAALADDGPEGLASAAALLEGHGYTVRAVDLLAEPSVPADCRGVVVAAPQAPLDEASSVLAAWLAAEGRLLLLADPVSDVDLSPVVADLGLTLRRGIVLEGDPAAVRPDDPTAPIVRTYSSSHPVVRRLPPTFFPGLQQVVVGASDPATGLVVSRLADTSAASYLETEPLTSEFDPSSDVGGPITVAAATERSAVEADRIRRSRAIVVADVDFATNAVLGVAANSTLLVRALDWLTLDDQLVVLSANLPADRTLELTAARLTYARFVSLLLLPGLFLLAGAAVWVVHRAR